MNRVNIQLESFGEGLGGFLRGTFVLFFASLHLQAAPANDAFAEPTELVGKELTVQGNNSEATVEPEEKVGDWFTNSFASVWYSWTAPAEGTLHLNASFVAPGYYLRAMAFRGDAIATLTPALTALDGAVPVVAGDQVRIQVASLYFPQLPNGSNAGPFTLNLRLEQPQSPPPNDAFADRIELVGKELTVQGDNAEATIEPGEITTNSPPNLIASVWYSWTAPAKGVLHWSASAAPPGFYIQSAVYRGDTITSLTPAPTALGGGIPVVTGDRLNIQVASFPFILPYSTGTTGPFTLDLRLEESLSTSLNDEFTNRVTISTLPYHFEGSVDGATSESGEPLPSAGAIQTLWWEFIPTNTGVLTVTVQAPQFSPRIALYEGSELGSLVATFPTTTSPLTFTLLSGRHYVLQLASGSVSVGNFTLDTEYVDTFLEAAPNDSFTNSIHLEGASVAVAGNNAVASMELNEVPPLAGSVGRTVWYSWVAPLSGRITIRSHCDYFFQGLAVYTGPTLDHLQRVGVGKEAAIFMAEAGTVYHIQVDGMDNKWGDFTMKIDSVAFQPALNDAFDHATPINGTWGVVGQCITDATVEPGEPVHRSGAIKTVWWRWQVAQNGMGGIGDNGSFVPDTLFAVYTGSSVDTLTLVAKGTNHVPLQSVVGGAVYYIAAVVDASAKGDVVFNYSSQSLTIDWEHMIIDHTTPYHPVEGNVLSEASFEGTWLGSSWTVQESPTIFSGALYDIKSFAQKLIAPSRAVDEWVVTLLSPATQTALANYQSTGSGFVAIKGPLAQDLNQIIYGPPIYNSQRFSAITLRPETEARLSENLQGFDLARLNRMLIDDAYPQEIYKMPLQGGCGGHVGEPGGADGGTWVQLQVGAALNQEFATLPGVNYELKFAFGPEATTDPASARVRVLWDNVELGIGESPASDGRYWHWTNFLVKATGTTSRITFEILEGIVGMDGFSVVPAMAPPVIITSSASISTFEGSAASFHVGASGSPPLAYQWYFNGAPLPGEVGRVLSIDPVTSPQGGQYHVVVSNASGTVTSDPATLVVETATSPTITSQPYGGTVAAGTYQVIGVAAVGTAPLFYQWFFNDTPLPHATNDQFIIPYVVSTNAGSYSVKVWNAAETVWSLPTKLTVETNLTGGGAVKLCNELPDGGHTRRALVYDVDGITPLSGPEYLAQLYAGPSLDSIRPVGPPRPFLTGFDAGLISSTNIVLPTVPVSAAAYLQVRVWQNNKGASYEEARSRGGRFGKSDILQVTCGVLPYPPPPWGLQSFSLQAGLPQFTAGKVGVAERRTDGSTAWSLEGQAGYRYVIEKAAEDFVWRPLMVITNITGAINFTDPAPPATGASFYRARILD